MHVDDPTEKVIKEEIQNTTINRFGALIKILEILIDLKKIKKFIQSKDEFNEFSRYLKSYEFSICFCLNQLIDIFWENPNFFGFKEDRLFKRAIDRIVQMSKFPNDTELCRIALNIYGLIDSSLKAKTSEELKKVVSNIKNYILNPFREIFYASFNPANKYKDLKIDILLLRLARSYFHLVFHDGKKIWIAYQDIIKKGDLFRAQLEPDYFNKLREKNTPIKEISSLEEMSDLLNHSKISRTGNMRERLGDQLFFDGYKLIIHFLWNELFKEPFSIYEFLNKMVLSKDWEEFDEFYEKINEDVIKPLEKKNKAIDPFFKKVFNKMREISSDNLKLLKQKIRFPLKNYKMEKDLTNNEKLDRKFLWYDVKMVCSKLSIPCSNHFLLVLTGIMSLNNEFTEVIKFNHPKSYGNNYSYAILIEGPMYSILADYASWYIFLDFATNHSGTGGFAKRRVDEIIKTFESKIHLIEYTIDSEILKEYVKDKEVKELSELLSDFEDNYAIAKGMIIELLHAYVLSKLGFKVFWSLKEEFTSNKEIDLIAWKEFRKRILFYVIELSITEKNLFEEVQAEIEILKKNSSNLLKFLDLEEYSNLRFRGIAISDIATNLKANINIKVINLRDIINNLKFRRIELKKKLLNILET